MILEALIQYTENGILTKKLVKIPFPDNYGLKNINNDIIIEDINVFIKKFDEIFKNFDLIYDINTTMSISPYSYFLSMSIEIKYEKLVYFNRMNRMNRINNLFH